MLPVCAFVSREALLEHGPLIIVRVVAASCLQDVDDGRRNEIRAGHGLVGVRSTRLGTRDHREAMFVVGRLSLTVRLVFGRLTLHRRVIPERFALDVCDHCRLGDLGPENKRSGYGVDHVLIRVLIQTLAHVRKDTHVLIGFVL
jgi:hypothetical protein